MEIKVWPWKPGDKGVLCIPLVRNISTPLSHKWRPFTCPQCGRDCRLTDAAQQIIDSGMPALCTECALRASMMPPPRRVTV